MTLREQFGLEVDDDDRDDLERRSDDEMLQADIERTPAITMNIDKQGKISVPSDLMFKTESAREIVTELIPEWIEYFLPKNADYGDFHHELGSKAQFVDIWRKARKMKNAIWDDQEMNHEGADEILKDMIGHCFLALQLRKIEEGKS